MLDQLTESRVAAGLGASWHTANDSMFAEGRRVLIDDLGWFDRDRMIGVEHV